MHLGLNKRKVALRYTAVPYCDKHFGHHRNDSYDSKKERLLANAPQECKKKCLGTLQYHIAITILVTIDMIFIIGKRQDFWQMHLCLNKRKEGALLTKKNKKDFWQMHLCLNKRKESARHS